MRRAEFALTALLLAVTVLVVEYRRDGPWSEGLLTLVALVPAVLLVVLAGSLPRDEDGGGTHPATTVVLVAGLAVTGLAVVRLGLLLDGDAGEHGLTRGALLVAFLATAGGLARRTGSGVALLLAALTAVGLVVSLVVSVAGADDLTTFRAVSFGCFAALMAGGVAVGHERGGMLVAAAGVVLLLFPSAGLPYVYFLGGEDEASWGWAAASGAGALALAIYAMVHKARGPGYQAAFALLNFVIAVGASTAYDPETGEATELGFGGWPVALIVLTVLAAAAAVRPGRAAAAG